MFTIIDLCLLCLTNNTNLKRILSKDSDGVIVKEKLKSLISEHINLELEDSMLYICLPCLEKLNNVFNYKQLCLSNISRFNYFIQKLKSTDDTNRNLQVILIDTNTKQQTCGNELNGDSITSENSKIDHGTVQDLNEFETKHRQVPEVVGEILTKESNEIRYVNLFDDIDINKAQEEIDIKEEVVPKFLDDESLHEFHDEIVKEETELNYDIIDVKLELLNGTDNNEESTSKTDPKSTDETSHECHTGEKPYEPDVHGQVYNHHKLTNSGTKPYKCDMCDKTYSAQCSLVKHKRYHTGDKPFKCNVCDETFTERYLLVKHKHTHTGENPFKCDICDKTFTKEDSLKTHKCSHTGEKPLKCDICDKRFNKKSTLKVHKYSHTGEKPFKCDICEKTFTTSRCVVRHKRCHTGEKPYKCDICDKSFTERYILKRHRRKHNEKKPYYKCDVCDKTFRNSSNLVTHKRCHTGEKPYKCDICDKTFSQPSNLLNHNRCHVGEKPRQNI